jgi:pyruvate dehydrogenase E2 component (dihydrolipoamide acetyltransferase)
LTELTLPLLGDVMTEGTVTAWLQADGSAVRQGDPLYTLETDKVTFTVDAPSGGRLQRLVAEGATVPVGTLVGRLVAADAPPAAAELSAVAPTPAVAAAAERPVAAVPVEAEAAAEHEVRASPAARRLARKLGIDLKQIANGRRLREADVQAVADRQSAATQPPALSVARPLVGGAKLRGRRKVIAERMRASLAQTAQLTISMQVDMTDTMALRAQLQQLFPAPAQPTITDLVLRASVLALQEHPRVNATFVDDELIEHAAVHLGLAVDHEDGLIVPVIRDAHALSLRQLAERTRYLAEAARASQLGPDELQGGTFTVTSLGQLGVDFFTPIINPPQVAILGTGRVYPQADQRHAMYLNLSFDHQVIDGAPAARFLQAVKRNLELPAALLL